MSARLIAAKVIASNSRQITSFKSLNNEAHRPHSISCVSVISNLTACWDKNMETTPVSRITRLQSFYNLQISKFAAAQVVPTAGI